MILIHSVAYTNLIVSYKESDGLRENEAHISDILFNKLEMNFKPNKHEFYKFYKGEILEKDNKSHWEKDLRSSGKWVKVSWKIELRLAEEK